jgi:hypothetical protein
MSRIQQQKSNKPRAAQAECQCLRVHSDCGKVYKNLLELAFSELENGENKRDDVIKHF